MAKPPYSEVPNENLILRDRLAMDRTVLANDRTLLAYVRTGLAFLITGVGLIKFFEGFVVQAVGASFSVVAVIVFFIGLRSYIKMKWALEAIERSERKQDGLQ